MEAFGSVTSCAGLSDHWEHTHQLRCQRFAFVSRHHESDLRKPARIVRGIGVTCCHPAGLPTAAVKVWVGKHCNLGLEAIAHDRVENPFAIMTETKGVGLGIAFLCDAALMGRTQ